MDINKSCEQYFNGFHELGNWKKNDKLINAGLALKVMSYFTLVVPLFMGVIYAAASLYGRMTYILQPSRLEQKINQLAQKQLEPQNIEPKNIESQNIEPQNNQTIESQKNEQTIDFAELDEWGKKEGGYAANAIDRIKWCVKYQTSTLILGGLGLKSLPPQIGNLVQLERLDLSDNKLENFPLEIGNLSNLQELHLQFNKLENLPPEIGNFSNLNLLRLENNQLQNLPTEIGNLFNLTHLRLDNNQLQKLPTEIGNLSNLKEVNFSNNQLQNLPPEIGSLSNLTHLRLENNQLQNSPPEIGNLSNLTYLRLDHNQLQNLPPEIGNLSNLKQVNFSNNQLQNLPPEIGNLSNLIVLMLNHNKLENLPSQIGRLFKLLYLSFPSNPSLQDLPLSLGQCPGLTTIDNENTRISEPAVNRILELCQATRNRDVLPILSKRLQAWLEQSQEKFDFTFIDDLDLSEKITINEWLLRLEKTNDYKTECQKELATTVCGMLHSLEKSKNFKETFFNQVAANQEACGDRAAMAFNELYLAWKLEMLDPALSEKERLNVIASAAKTATLRQILQNLINDKEKEQGKPISEGVEIFLYYETHLSKTLGLLTFMDSMLYSAMGKSSWIDEASLMDQVEKNYLQAMMDSPALIAIRDTDKKYQEEWGLVDAKFAEELEQLLSGSNTSNILEETKKIQEEREIAQRAHTRTWLTQKMEAV